MIATPQYRTGARMDSRFIKALSANTYRKQSSHLRAALYTEIGYFPRLLL
jgi:hypothetical protein